jgi:tetratricopeptide (TPR) repeat protein
VSLDRALAAADALKSRNEHAHDLGVLVSLAVHVEPALLRSMRLEFLPRSDASAEADLWFSELVQTRSARGIVLLPEAATLLRDRLKVREDLERVWERLCLVHADLAPLLQLEEKLAWMAVSGAAKADIADELARVLSAMDEEPGRAPDLAAWAVRALPRQHEDVQGTTAAWTLALAASTHTKLAPALTVRPPAELANVSPPATMLPPRAADVALEIRRTDDWVELRHPKPGAAPAGPTLMVPSTDPRVVVLGGTAGASQIVTLRPGGRERVRVPAGNASALVTLANLRGERWQLRPLGAPTPAAAPKTRTLRWLHLSDPTFSEGPRMGSTVTVEHLGRLSKEGEAPEIVFLTGDVTVAGRPSEFSRAGEYLNRLFAAVEPRPLFFVVPGNHDHARQSPGVSRASDDAPWWKQASHPEREVLRRTFQNYGEWASSLRPAPAREGIVPGDRLTSVELPSGLRVGVLALNTAYDGRRAPAKLQRVAISEHQVRALFGILDSGKGLDLELLRWRNSHHLTFLLTHHPPRMFPKKAQLWFKDEVAPHVDIHLCGATHGSGGADVMPGLVVQASPAHLVRGAVASNFEPASLTFGEATVGWEINIRLATYEFDPGAQSLKTSGPSNYGIRRNVSDLDVPPAGDIPALPEELASEAKPARPPQFNESFPHPESIVGRGAEVEQLHAWFRDDADAQRVMCVEGPAGIGKSALVATWLRQVLMQPKRGGVFEDSAIGPVEDVLLRAVKYFSGNLEHPPASPSELLSELLVYLRGRPAHLMVLDDFHHAFGESDEDYKPWRDLVDAFHGHPNAKLLLVMRNVGSQLNVPFLTLGGLDIAAALELLRREGAAGPPEMLSEMAAWSGGNPLYLSMLAGALLEGWKDWPGLARRPPPSSAEELRELLASSPRLLSILVSQLDALTLRLERGEDNVPIDDALAAARKGMTELGDVGRAQVAFAMGRLLSRARRWTEAIESLDVVDRSSNSSGNRGRFYRELARAREGKGELERAVRDFTDAREAFAAVGDDLSGALTLADRGRVLTESGKYEQALQDLQKARQELEFLGAGVGERSERKVPSMPAVLSALGLVESKLGRLEQARDHYEEALQLSIESGQQLETANILRASATVAVQLGDTNSARAMYERAIKVLEGLGAFAAIAEAVTELARLWISVKDLASAKGAFSRALALFERLGQRDAATAVRRARDALDARERQKDRRKKRKPTAKKARKK